MSFRRKEGSFASDKYAADRGRRKRFLTRASFEMTIVFDR